MAEEIRIRVPWDVNRTSKNQRLHWRERWKRNQRAREAAFWAWKQAGSPQLDGAAKVTIIARRGRRLDASNILGGAEPCTDALCTRKLTGHGVLTDDGDDHLEWVGIKQECGKDWVGREEVEYIFVSRDEEAAV